MQSSWRNRLGTRPVEQFFAEMSVERLIGIVVLVIVLGGCIALDLTDAVWDPNPFTTNAASGLVLAVLSILLIDEFLSFRAARAWDAVAAFALEDLGRVARAVWVRHASFIQPEYDATRVEPYRHSFGRRRAPPTGAAALRDRRRPDATHQPPQRAQ